MLSDQVTMVNCNLPGGVEDGSRMGKLLPGWGNAVVRGSVLASTTVEWDAQASRLRHPVRWTLDSHWAEKPRRQSV